MKQVPNACRENRSAASGRRGAVVVELALIMPFLILVFLVVADLGLLLQEHQVLENAAREGARFSSLQKNWVDPVRNPGASFAEIKQYVVDYCARQGTTIAAGNVDVNQNASFVVSGTTVRASEVTVSVDRELFLPSTLFFDSTTVNLKGRAVFRNFYGN